MEITANRNLQEGRIEKILTRLRRVYLAFFILGGISLLFHLADFDQSNLREIGGLGIALAVNGFAYIGFRRRRSWVIPLVLATSAVGFFLSLCTIIDPAGDIPALVGKGFSCLVLFFCGYQISFFPKRDVRLFFRAKGQVLF